MCLNAFTSNDEKNLNIFKVHDIMGSKGWHMSPIQKPAGLHMCFTPAHNHQTVELLIEDLKQSIKILEEDPTKVTNIHYAHLESNVLYSSK